jgi:hypothetical protein
MTRFTAVLSRIRVMMTAPATQAPHCHRAGNPEAHSRPKGGGARIAAVLSAAPARRLRVAVAMLALLVPVYPALAYTHAHVPHACPRNKKNPNAICPGHKPPQDDGKTHAGAGGVDTLGCGCASPYDVLMCFFGY